MKKVIDGKLYNTETAQNLGYWWNGLSTNDFGYLREALYQTKSGKYFLHGIGGARTGYAESYGSLLHGSEAIIPLSTEEAQDFAENHLSADEYIAAFGEPVEA